MCICAGFLLWSFDFGFELGDFEMSLGLGKRSAGIFWMGGWSWSCGPFVRLV